ncbi:hypothetical protein M231_02923 [Tremella mesenterica]|uniref:Fanconi-associated nuclease n=1 Tax=Tremella mesenterica TaxID=5217 RepID=A0A4Q1BPJ7_TREME|nr:hypothetical protein M231_02923 [Tremella mesenterica]
MNSSPPPPSLTLPPPHPSRKFSFEDAQSRPSMYVSLFKEMVDTVLASDSYLFTHREVSALRYILDLPYEPKYLLIRLLLRRPGKIHSLSSLVAAYASELGEHGVGRGMEALLGPIPISDCSSQNSITDRDENQKTMSPKARTRQAVRPWDDISTGMTAAEEEADPDLAEAIRKSMWTLKDPPLEVITSSPIHIAMDPHLQACGGAVAPHTSSMTLSSSPITALVHDESDMSFSDIMTSVSAEDLRRFARQRKVPLKATANKEAVMNALTNLAYKQTVLIFSGGKGKSSMPKPPAVRSTSCTAESRLKAQLLPYVGFRVIRLTPEVHNLIRRLNLIFSRIPPTASGSSLMLPSILVTSHKRRYPDYGPPTRSVIWRDREELLKWEGAAHLEAAIGEALGDDWNEQRSDARRAWKLGQRLSRTDGAQKAKQIWQTAWPVWQSLVEGARGEAMGSLQVRNSGALAGDRFAAGHVLTRVVYKGAIALGILHEYDEECKVLRALLRQHRWRRGKRGAWYGRLALILMNHYNASLVEKELKMREATQVCIDGLLDEDTHLIFRPSLSRRLGRLEKKLNLPADERHISHAELAKCQMRELSATRVLENLGRPKLHPTRSNSTRGASPDVSEDESAIDRGLQQVGKSVWMGTNGEVTVEGWVLEWWERRGYKGFHSEGSILTTLFGLLMWPILFHPLPGAFETAYQIAPLDLGEDTFATARAELIELRLMEMSETARAIEMLREADHRERPNGTWAVGISWEYPADDLEEILECLGGAAMTTICRMLCEEYRHRVSGVPDLIVWDAANKDIRFVEVKGPGDSLSETQKIWIDVLLSAGVAVEVCRVKELEAPDQSLRPKKKMKIDAGGTARRRGKARDITSDVGDVETRSGELREGI